MTSKQNESKVHHFVTQAQLRHFASDNRQKFVMQFDKETSRSYACSIAKNAGSQQHFNTVVTANGRKNFEHIFEDVDRKSAKLVKDIIANNSVAWLQDEDHDALVNFLSLQLIRTPLVRATHKHLAAKIRGIARQCGYNPDEDSSMSMPSDAQLKLNTEQRFDKIESYATLLRRLQPALYRCDENERFLLSDHPIVITNQFPYGDTGLASHGILVTIPITPALMIAMHCPTIVRRYEQLDEIDLNPRMDRYRKGLRSGTPISIDDKMVRSLNQHQVVQSERFLYSAEDNFDFVRGLLKNHTEFRTNETLITMGELGQGLPARMNMPKGAHLVVIGGHDHCMLQLEEIDESGEGITARTQQIDLLSQIATDPNELRVELYQDQRVSNMMAQVTFERLGVLAQGWFRVVPRDKEMRSLFAQLDTEKR
ncbi:MAG: DUF4238 domain-containing protein [Paracoccaceae bacterium]